jgi:hypothetical protein
MKPLHTMPMRAVRFSARSLRKHLRSVLELWVHAWGAGGGDG